MSYFGIYDWGIGGLGFYKSFKKQYPDVPTLYLSDSGYTPYGKVSANDLQLRVLKVLNWLKAQNCTSIMVACNAASSVLVNHPVEDCSHIIASGVKTVLETNVDSVAIIGGKRTVESHVYQKLLHGVNVNEVIAQPISGLIEKGDISSENLRLEIRKVFQQIEVEVVLLACTHYPAAIDLMKQEATGKLLLDPVETAVRNLNHERIYTSTYKGVWMTTGSQQGMAKAAKQSFNVDIDEISQISI